MVQQITKSRQKIHQAQLTPNIPYLQTYINANEPTQISCTKPDTLRK